MVHVPDWEPYLPELIVRELALHPDADLRGFEQRFTAVVLFADISGFSALSTALAVGQRGGAEELTGVLNVYLGPAIALVEQYGGSVAKFGGDALTALFPYATDADESAAVHRAAACALAIQAHVAAYAQIVTRVGTFTLATRIGLASGPLLALVVGEPASRLELLLSGSALTQAAAAERAATPGDVTATAAIRALLGAANAAATGFAPLDPACLIDVPPPSAAGAPLPALSQAASDRAAGFLSEALARRIVSNQSALLNEHRHIGVLFAAFTCPGGLAADDAAALRAYFAQVFAVVQRYAGYVNKIDIGDKGCTYLVVFGAPVAHEDDVARALRCALELQALTDGPIATERIGVAVGVSYCGEVGAAHRREYTVIGDGVNLAARLMQAAAPGQILAAEGARRSADGGLQWGERVELVPHGWRTPVPVSPLLGADLPAARSSAGAVLVGRNGEVALLRTQLDLAMRGRGRVVTISGAAGLGKSALAAALLDEAAARGARCVRGECVSYRAASSYLVWQRIMRSLIGIDPHWSRDRQAAALTDWLTALDPQAAERVALLGPVVGLTLPETELTRTLEAPLRKAALETMVLESISRLTIDTPLVIGLESCDWIDPLSRDLLAVLVRAAAHLPLLLIITHRELPAPLPAERPAHVRTLALNELAPAAATELIDQVAARLWGADGELPVELVQRVAARAQGNPLYIEELLGLAHDRGVDLRDLAAIARLDLPDSLQSLVLSRIDRLGEDARTTLKVASVIGDSFSPALIAGVYPALGDADQLRRGLDELQRSDLAVLERPGPDPAYLFRHVITREVAYASLTNAARADLHARTGAFLERRHADELDRHLDLLAYHYGLSANQIKQREYFLRAGVAAQLTCAFEAAAGFFERLLPLLHRHERSDGLIRYGEVVRLLGRWDDAEVAYAEALELAPDQRTRARAQAALGELSMRRGNFSAARDVVEQSRALYRALGDRQGAGEATEYLGLIAWSQGDLAGAIAHLQAALATLAHGDEGPRAVQLINNIGLIYWAQDDLPRAIDCFERAMRGALAQGNRRVAGIAVGNLGNVYAVRGDYGKALDCYTQKLQAARATGDRLELGISLSNLGTIYEYQGEFERAMACYARGLALALDLGDKLGVGLALWSTGGAALGAGQFARAEEALDRAAAVLEAIEAEGDLGGCLCTHADLELRRGQPRIALSLLHTALPLLAAGGDRELELRARLLMIVAERTLRHYSPAAAAERAVELLDSCTRDAERAAVLYTIATVDGARAQDRAAAAKLYRALHIRTPNVEYRRRYRELMGVALPPPPPLPALPAIVAEPAPAPASLFAQVDELIDALMPLEHMAAA
jgi:class 3 adenylate cyclase/tetratricopeptide (TPR) repeat protein